MVFEDLCCFPDELVAHVIAELTDMCLSVIQTELVGNPAVGFRFGQDALSPDLIEDPVSLNPFLTQFPVGKCSFGNPGPYMHPDIGVTGWIVGADIDLPAFGVVSVYKRCIS